VEDVDQVERRLRAFGRCRLGGADIPAATDESGGNRDEFGRDAAGALERGGGLAGRGRTPEGDGQRLACGGIHVERQTRSGIAYCPRWNSLSRSDRPSCTHVGRPWLHWSARSVASIWRSSAFISGTVRMRLARTAVWQASVP